MRTRPIRSLERLCDAVTVIEAAFPCWSERTGRDLDYFARRFPSHSSLYFTLDDAAGTIGVALPTVDKDVVVLDTEFVAPSADSPSVRAIMANEISAAAVAMNATRMAVPAGSQLAETYEEIGFAPTLFLQFDGKRSRYWRQHAIDQLSDLRLLQVRSHGEDVSQAVFRLEHVDRRLLADCERDYNACNGSLFMMHRWIGPSEQRLDPDGSVIFRRPRYVVTHYPRFRKPALSEVQRVDPRTEVVNADSARTIVSGATPGCGVAEAFQAQHPTFVQHLAPVRARVRLDGHAGDLARISSAVDRVQPLDRNRTFAVQCRKAECTITGPHGESPYGARDVEVRVGSHLEGAGLTVDRDCPDQVISVLLSGPHAFVGASKVEDNLAVHADEHRRRSTRSRVVSRARHKLEEAIDTFRIPVGPSTRVLDLGAAPGGWTALLLLAGATVVAVDPGALSPAVAAHPRVLHLRCRIEETSLTGSPFKLIVNDMSLDPTESAALMCRAARTLESGGHAVMTIKLPSLRVHAHLRDATRILEHAYHVVDIRHLFHNRQEVTAHLIRGDTITDGWQRHLVKRPR